MVEAKKMAGESKSGGDKLTCPEDHVGVVVEEGGDLFGPDGVAALPVVV